MRLRQSAFAHVIPIAVNSALLLNAVSQLRLKVDGEVSRLMDYFREARDLPDCYPELIKLVPYDRTALAACIHTLIDRGFLTEKTPDEEMAALGEKLGATYGRDPGALLDRYRRERQEGADARWTNGVARGLKDLVTQRQKIDILLLGDCDVHTEADFLNRAAAEHGFDLRVAATALDDVALAAERKHEAIIIGALPARYFITQEPAADQEPHTMYIAQARQLLRQLREKTAAPIFIDNLPEPTVQPLGLAERGLSGHRARFRRANLALAEVADEFADVHVADIAAALGMVGSLPLIDDWQVDFAHMGSAGWMLQRPESEKAAVHDQMPDMKLLAQLTGGGPYAREAVVARLHVDMVIAALGIGRKKCVIVDLDDTLWPGVLAETGAPFAWDPAISGPFSFIGLYFGLHEALLSLKKRGIVLACVSKNDEAVVRELWKYPEFYPKHRLLKLDDFVACRINWEDKAANIRSIADELGFALDSFLFIDDNPAERDRVQKFLPEIEVWGENPFALRRALLDDPRLQVPHITAESSGRTEMVKAQLDRQKFRAATADENAYLSSLQVKVKTDLLQSQERLDRIEELFRRTTQFNATGRLFTAADLRKLMADPHVYIFTLHVSDRFGDHGLVGAAVVEHGEITGLVLSCRVLGMGVEHQFIQAMLASMTDDLTATIVETSRNLPVRNIYRDNGFVCGEDGVWRYSSGKSRSFSPV